MAIGGSFSYKVRDGQGREIGLALECDWVGSNVNYTTSTIDINFKVYVRHSRISVGSRAGSTVKAMNKTTTYTAVGIDQNVSGNYRTLITPSPAGENVIGASFAGQTKGNLSVSWAFNGTYNNVYVGEIVATGQIDFAPPSVSFSVSKTTPSSFTINAVGNPVCDLWEYSINNGSSWTTFSTAVGTTALVNVTGLTGGTEYKVLVRARRLSNERKGVSEMTSVVLIGGSNIDTISRLPIDNPTQPRLNFKWTVLNSNYTHTIRIKYNGDTIATFTGITGTAGTQWKQIPLTTPQQDDILELMVNDNYIDTQLELDTFSGGTLIGSQTGIAMRIYTSQENSGPGWTGAFVQADMNTTTADITESNLLFIQHQSLVRVVVTGVAPINKAVMSSYSVTIGEKTVTSGTSTIDYGTIDYVGTNIPITVTIIDSRGYSATESKTISVIPYESPVFTDWSSRRRTDVGDVAKINFAGRYSQLNIGSVSKNKIVKIEVRDKKTDSNTWGAFEQIYVYTYSDGSFQNTGLFQRSFDDRYSYNVELKVTDEITSSVIAFVVPPLSPLVSFRDGKVGINTNYPQAELDVVGDIILNGVSLSELLNIDPFE